MVQIQINNENKGDQNDCLLGKDGDDILPSYIGNFIKPFVKIPI